MTHYKTLTEAKVGVTATVLERIKGHESLKQRVVAVLART